MWVEVGGWKGGGGDGNRQLADFEQLQHTAQDVLICHHRLEIEIRI